MKANLKVNTNKNIDYYNELLSKSMIDIDMVKDGLISVEDIALTNINYLIKKNNVLEFDDIEIKFTKETVYQIEDNIQSNIESFIVFKNFLDLGKELDELIEINDMNNINKKSMLEQNDFYKQTIINVLKRNNNLFNFTTRIVQLIKKYGFITTTNIENINDVQICNVSDFLHICYLIYECYYLNYYIKNLQKVKLSINNYYNDNNTLSEERQFEYITNLLDYLSTCTTQNCSYISEFDNDNERWETILIFDNALALAIYELRIQLSYDEETSIGICKNKACRKSFVRYTKKQEYCNPKENIECNMSRQRQRKKEELARKNKLKSTQKT